MAIELRPYQRRTIDELYGWFNAGNTGNPCVVLPTGGGKSHIVAALCKDALQNWPETRILMLTHVKELIEQNCEKMLQHWPDAPLGIYSASLNKRQIEPITFAGIQSVRRKADLLGHIDLVLVDECHLINHKDEGGYRTLLSQLKLINPALRVIGLTATPYRLGHGMITDEPALFHGLIEPVMIEELIYKGYLSILRSKNTKFKLSVDGVHKKGGEYIESELQAAVDNELSNAQVVAETISRAVDRKAWLFFCAGVKHAENICEELIQQGIKAACVTGETPKTEREQILADFKSGALQALTNANVLTTGFDHSAIDLIAMCRPTMSPGLYVQMAGRGLRPSPGKQDCLVLDFAGVVGTHGPITAVTPPKKPGEGNGVIPMKTCPQCDDLVHIAVMVCPNPECGHVFEAQDKAKLKLHDNVDIMGLDGTEMTLTGWKWREHTSLASGKLMLAVSYYGRLSDPAVTEYFPVLHEGYAGQRAMKEVIKIADRAKIVGMNVDNLSSLAAQLSCGNPPIQIKYKKDGKFFRVLKKEWHEN
jgi:DNA repair protein RadD